MTQQKTSAFIQYFVKPALLGVFVAAIVLVVLPLLDQDSSGRVTRGELELLTYANAVELAAPAVVNIYTEQSIRDRRRPRQERSILGLGSGVIMDSRGYILTANHVVANVDIIQVALQDGRIFGAQLIGRDELTDLAVLRIEADNLPVIPRNRDYRPRAGDVVLAIGNPYNLGQTVTQGIISATGRTNTGSGYSESIQTDAAINSGNSGGALVNSRGELVGINSARYLSNEGSTGIHFSIVYRVAQQVMQQIISEGSVTRGYLGVVAEQFFHEQLQIPGIRLEEVERNGPAYRAGLRAGDFIFRIGGQDIRTLNQGLDIVADTRPGTELPIEFVRAGQRVRTVALIERLEPQN